MMPHELVHPIVSLTFLAICCLAAEILVRQRRRSQAGRLGHDSSENPSQRSPLLAAQRPRCQEHGPIGAAPPHFDPSSAASALSVVPNETTTTRHGRRR